MYIHTCMHTCAHIHIYIAYDYRKSYMRECEGKITDNSSQNATRIQLYSYCISTKSLYLKMLFKF